MPKFYVASGPLRLIIDAEDAEDAAVRALQWSCDDHDNLQATMSDQHVSQIEEQSGDLQEDILVSETGFGQTDARAFDTLEIVAAWQAYAFPWVQNDNRQDSELRSLGTL